MAAKRIELSVGERHHRLTVLEFPVPGVRKQGALCARVFCDCGQEAIVKGSSIKRGNTKSCGCLQRENRIRHGCSRTPEYKAWTAAKKRCRNPRDPRYQHYGARGIRMCEAWSESFPNFLADMGPRPSPRHTLERLNVDGHYEPGNCVWATYAEQNRNLRSNVVVIHDGRRYLIRDLAKAVGLSCKTVENRRFSRKWPKERWLEPYSVEEAVKAFTVLGAPAQPT